MRAPPEEQGDSSRHSPDCLESDGIVVQQTEVTNADIAVSVGSRGWLRQSADNTKVRDNVADETEYGCLMESVAEPYGGVLTQSDPTVTNTKVMKNDLTGEDDPEGVSASASSSKTTSTTSTTPRLGTTRPGKQHRELRDGDRRPGLGDETRPGQPVTDVSPRSERQVALAG